MLLRRLARQLRSFAEAKPTHYETLGLRPACSMEEVRSRYIELAKVHHPDVNNQERSMFQQISHAYETLSDANRRFKYDLSLGLTPSWQEVSSKSAQFTSDDHLYEEILNKEAPKPKHPDELLADRYNEWTAQIQKPSTTDLLKRSSGWLFLFFLTWNLYIVGSALSDKQDSRRQLDGLAVVTSGEGYRVAMLPLNIT